MCTHVRHPCSHGLHARSARRTGAQAAAFPEHPLWSAACNAHPRKWRPSPSPGANDILSFHKEGALRTALNLPSLLIADGGLPEDQALLVSAGIHNAEMRHYLSLRRKALEDPALISTPVRAWMHDLDIVIRGLLEWQLLAARYTLGRSVTVHVEGHFD